MTSSTRVAGTVAALTMAAGALVAPGVAQAGPSPQTDQAPSASTRTSTPQHDRTGDQSGTDILTRANTIPGALRGRWLAASSTLTGPDRCQTFTSEGVNVDLIRVTPTRILEFERSTLLDAAKVRDRSTLEGLFLATEGELSTFEYIDMTLEKDSGMLIVRSLTSEKPAAVPYVRCEA